MKKADLIILISFCLVGFVIVANKTIALSYATSLSSQTQCYTDATTHRKVAYAFAQDLYTNATNAIQQTLTANLATSKSLPGTQGVKLRHDSLVIFHKNQQQAAANLKLAQTQAFKKYRQAQAVCKTIFQ